jgi:transposase
MTSVFAGFRFPREVISLAVRWYLRYGLSYRDVEELLAERGVTVDHVSIYRWVLRFTQEFIEAAKPVQPITAAPPRTTPATDQRRRWTEAVLGSLSVETLVRQ